LAATVDKRKHLRSLRGRRTAAATREKPVHFWQRRQAQAPRWTKKPRIAILYAGQARLL
jgi:hypothetical protein